MYLVTYFLSFNKLFVNKLHVRSNFFHKLLETQIVFFFASFGKTVRESVDLESGVKAAEGIFSFSIFSFGLPNLGLPLVEKAGKSRNNNDFLIPVGSTANTSYFFSR